MTISNDINQVQYTSQQVPNEVFPVTFEFFDSDDLQVFNLSSGEKFTLGSDYDVNGGNGNVGNVVWNSTSPAGQILIVRRTKAIQPVELPEGGPFPAESVEQGLDRQITVSASALRLRDTDARVWDAASGDQLVVLSGHAGPVLKADWNPTESRIVTAGAKGLKMMLRFAAVWVDADPDEVSVKPNKDFVEDTLIGRDLVEIMTAKHLGAPLSERSVHALMRRKDLTRMEFEDEKDLIEDEDPVPIPPSAAQRGSVSVVADTDEPGGIRSRPSGEDD